VTDSFDPKAPKSSRRKHKREPATIDLKATVVHDTPTEEARPPEPEHAAENAAARPTDTLDSGPGVDSIGPAAAPETPVQEPLAQETPSQETPTRAMPADMAPAAEIPGQEVPAQETVVREEPVQDDPAGIRDTLAGSEDRRPEEEAPRAAEPSRDVPPPRDEPARRGSAGAIIGSGLLGGLIGAGLVYGLQEWRPQGPAPTDPRIVQLEQRVGALAQQRGTPGQPADAGALESRIAALESAAASVDQRIQAAQGAAEQATARAEEALNRPVPGAPAPQNDAAVAELTERVSRLDEQVQANLQQVQQVQAGLQRAQQVQGGLDQVRAELQQVRTESQGAAAARQAIEGRLAELDRRLAEQDRRAAEQEQRLADLSRQATERAEATTQPAIRVILAERLGDALRNGTPYADVLSALRNVETDPGRLGALEPLAQEGAPTAAELAQSFEPLGATILRDDRAAGGTWTDRLMRMADRVVTIRPVDAPDAAGVPGLVARVEQALARGDVAAAVSAWEALPEPARRQSEEWGRQAKARAEADAAAKAIASDAVAALNNRTTQ